MTLMLWRELGTLLLAVILLCGIDRQPLRRRLGLEAVARLGEDRSIRTFILLPIFLTLMNILLFE